jgi:hypothetical protein
MSWLVSELFDLVNEALIFPLDYNQSLEIGTFTNPSSMSFVTYNLIFFSSCLNVAIVWDYGFEFLFGI